jgi:hypothetical protein
MLTQFSKCIKTHMTRLFKIQTSKFLKCLKTHAQGTTYCAVELKGEKIEKIKKKKKKKKRKKKKEEAIVQ